MILGVLLGDRERASPDLTKGEVGFELRLVEEGILKNEERRSASSSSVWSSGKEKRAHPTTEHLRHSFKPHELNLGVEERARHLEEGQAHEGGLRERRGIAEAEDFSFEFGGEGRKNSTGCRGGLSDGLEGG